MKIAALCIIMLCLALAKQDYQKTDTMMSIVKTHVVEDVTDSNGSYEGGVEY
jgi:hypothetical protein